MTDANRKTIAGELAKLLGVTVPVPPSFEGIPVLNNQRSWFFAYADTGTGGFGAAPSLCIRRTGAEADDFAARR